MLEEIQKELTHRETEISQMFGKPCIKTGGKAFMAKFHGDLVFKIGKDRVAELLKVYEGSSNWDPSGKGRPMKDWLQVPVEFSGDWHSLAIEAEGFVFERI